jgi:hypothetical protein
MSWGVRYYDVSASGNGNEITPRSITRMAMMRNITEPPNTEPE